MIADLPRSLVIAGLVLWIVAQYGLIVVALRDLRRRAEVRGGNRVGWALAVLAVPFVGPLLYARVHPGAWPTPPRPRVRRPTFPRPAVTIPRPALPRLPIPRPTMPRLRLRRGSRPAAKRRDLADGICPPGVCSPDHPPAAGDDPGGGRPTDAAPAAPDREGGRA